MRKVWARVDEDKDEDKDEDEDSQHGSQQENVLRYLAGRRGAVLRSGTGRSSSA